MAPLHRWDLTRQVIGAVAGAALVACGGTQPRPEPAAVRAAAAADPCAGGCAVEVRNATGVPLDVKLADGALGVVRPHETERFTVVTRPMPQQVFVRPAGPGLARGRVRCRRSGPAGADTLRLACDSSRG